MEFFNKLISSLIKLYELLKKRKNQEDPKLPFRQGLLDRINSTRHLFEDYKRVRDYPGFYGETRVIIRKIYSSSTINDRSILNIYYYHLDHPQLLSYLGYVDDLYLKVSEFDAKWSSFFRSSEEATDHGQRNWKSLDVSNKDLQGILDETEKILTRLQKEVCNDISIEYQSRIEQSRIEQRSKEDSQ